MPPALAAVAIALAFPAPGFAGDDETEEHESTTRVSCLDGTAELRLDVEEDDEEDGAERGREIEIGLRVNVRRPVAVWRLTILHERRLVYHGLRRSNRSGYALWYERDVPDWHGRQTVVARLSTSDGRVCRLEATL